MSDLDPDDIDIDAPVYPGASAPTAQTAPDPYREQVDRDVRAAARRLENNWGLPPGALEARKPEDRPPAVPDFIAEIERERGFNMRGDGWRRDPFSGQFVRAR